MATNNSQQRLAYSINQPLNSIFPAPIVSTRNPTTNDKQPIGMIWVNKSSNAAYIETSVVNNLATWLLLEASGGAGVFNALTVTGPSSLTGATTINTAGAAATSIGVGGTGAVNIGNATGNTSISAGNLTVVAGTFTADSTGANVAIVGDSSAGTGVTATLTSSADTVDALQLILGGLKVRAVLSAVGASPRTINARFGQATFTDVINAAATGALTVSNSLSTAASVVLATVSCATVGSACVIRDINTATPGSIVFNVTNLGGTNTGANININFWLLD